MVQVTKRRRELIDQIDRNQLYKITEALSLVKSCSTSKFNESIDVALSLGVNPRQSDQVVRGSTILPNGTGRTVRVAVFAQGQQVDDALAAGADRAGLEDLVEEIQKGNILFDLLIATPECMPKVAQLGAILGPRGLMPNPKFGTVSKDVSTAVQHAKQGQVRYRTDKGAIIHVSIGKADFSESALKENLDAVLRDIKNHKKNMTVKGAYFKKLIINSTMGVGIHVDLSTLAVLL